MSGWWMGLVLAVIAAKVALFTAGYFAIFGDRQCPGDCDDGP